MDTNTPTEPSPPPRVQVKKENEEEIKEYAETAMNELLGWYGYERLELQRWAASRARDGSSPEQPGGEQKNKEECSWCNKNITSDGGALQQAGATFCSELCFSQSRRANFKRAKTCDWCRHVRHTVAYVDFQDGATQLQFCSDKCLNQYKMHIFCRETQAHLDLNPHLVNASSSSNLITPELWLKNCKSRSASPTSERSGSPNAEHISSKQANSEKTDTQKAHSRKSPLPLITIAPTAKLMKPKGPSEERISLQKSPEVKKDLRNNKMNLRKRRTSKCSATVTSQTVRHASTPKAQDLRLCSPSVDGSSPASTIGNTAIHSPPNPINPHPPPHPPPPSAFANPMYGIPPPVFVDNHQGHVNEHRLPHLFPPRLNFMPRPGMPVHQDRFRPPHNFPQPLGQAPPVTVLVPYPVIIPLPLPIPIPIPLTSFIQAHRTNKLKKEVKSDDTEGPLDFTMHSDKKKDEEIKETQNVEVNSSDSEENNIVCDHNNELSDRVEDEDKTESEVNESGNPEQTLPKFKITRLGNKMAKIVAKTREPPESSRPLRKRRRLVEATDDDPLIPKTRKAVQV